MGSFLVIFWYFLRDPAEQRAVYIYTGLCLRLLSSNKVSTCVRCHSYWRVKKRLVSPKLFFSSPTPCGHCTKFCLSLRAVVWGTDCCSRTPTPNGDWRQMGNNLTQALNFSSCQWELHLFVRDSDWNSHLALFETLSSPLVLTMDLKDVPSFSGRLWLEYHFSSRKQKTEERTRSERRKENSQPGNKYRWEMKSRDFCKIVK